jgi:hypothetical protein
MVISPFAYASPRRLCEGTPVSHELRTLLVAVICLTDALLQQSLGQDWRSRFSVMNASTARAAAAACETRLSILIRAVAQ